MFTPAERDRVRERLLGLAREDDDVVAAAITGSYTYGGDEWSDIDLAFGVRGDLAPVMERWTTRMYDELDAIHHWDLPFASTIYRVFLLPEWLQVDIAFTPAADFGPRGPNWRTVFGETVEIEPSGPASPRELVGHAWLFVRHAHVCIFRGLPLQAEWCVGKVRENVIALACLRLGLPARYARGADELPTELKEALEAALVRSLDESELRRALAAAAHLLLTELGRSDPEFGARLNPMLRVMTEGVTE